MQVTLIALGTAFLLTGPQPASVQPSSADSLTVTPCQVKLIKDIDLPARELGVLTEFTCREGMQVTEGQLLGRIDDEIEQKQKKATKARLEVARLQAANTARVDYSEATADVAAAEVEMAKDANRRHAGAVAAAELTRLNLAHRQAVLSIKQSQNDLDIDKKTVGVSEAEDELADLKIERRRLVAPVDGIVMKRYVDEHEWVQPGDTVLRIIRIDRMRIEGFVDASRVAHAQVREGQQVTIRAASGQSVTGELVFVSPELARGRFEVWAEVDNVRVGGGWLLLSGATVDMTIHLDRVAAPQQLVPAVGSK